MPIHPTAIIDPAAEIDPTAEIGPFVIIEAGVRVGPGTKVMAHSYLNGNTVIGANNEIHMGCVIGHTPQHLGYKGGDSGVRIGDGNTFREYVTIHRAYVPGTHTTIGNGCFIMGSSHIAHDCVLGNEIIMANQCLLAGHVQIGDKVNLSGHVGVHQFVRIGRLAMIGGYTKAVKDIPPFCMTGSGEGVAGLNSVGMRRAGMSPGDRLLLKRAFKVLYRSGYNVPQAVEHMEADSELMACAQVQELVEFIRNSPRGIAKSDFRGGSDAGEES